VFYFHLNTLEVTKLLAELGTDNLQGYVKTLGESKDMNQMLKFIEKIVLRSYGHKSEDGRSFLKDEASLSAFQQSEAYSSLFMSLLTNPEEAKAFAENLGTTTEPDSNDGLNAKAAAKLGVVPDNKE